MSKFALLDEDAFFAVTFCHAACLFSASVVAWCVYSVSSQAELFCHKLWAVPCWGLFCLLSAVSEIIQENAFDSLIWIYSISFFLCYGKFYLTYLKVAWYLILAWCWHALYVQHHHRALISLCGVALCNTGASCSSVFLCVSCLFVCFCPLVPGMQGSGADMERWKPATEGSAAPGVALCCGAWSDVCHCLLHKSWLSYQPCSESGLSGMFLNNLQIKLRQWIIWRFFWMHLGGWWNLVLLEIKDC